MLFIAGSTRKVRVGSILLVIANQTRRSMGLEDIQEHDPNKAIVASVEALRKLIVAEKR